MCITSNQNLFIGLMSGTSIDAMDAVLASFDEGKRRVIAKVSRSWQKDEKALLNSLCQKGENEIEQAGKAGIMIAKAQAQCVQMLLEKTKLKSSDIKAIGSHGQTVRHCPKDGFSIQLNNPSVLANTTNIDVISDFRAADLALGGEGAPLTPAFNAGFFANGYEPCYILNLGGIANITVLSEKGQILSGFDTGPANTLLDLCARMFLNSPFDKDATCAKAGQVKAQILSKYLSHPYFLRKPPKSTGRELFNEEFIKDEIAAVKAGSLSINDLMRTLVELTVNAASLALFNELKAHHLAGGKLILCGGGTKNPLIFELFTKKCAEFQVKVCDCSEFGADPDALEALSFAFFAYLFVNAIPLNLGQSSKAQGVAIAGMLTPALNGSYARSIKQLNHNQVSINKMKL